MLIDVVVTPRSPRFAITRQDGRIRIWLTEEAEKNRANAELIKGLERLTGAGVRIVSGFKSRHKTLDIDIGKEEWEEIIRRFSKK